MSDPVVFAAHHRRILHERLGLVITTQPGVEDVGFEYEGLRWRLHNTAQSRPSWLVVSCVFSLPEVGRSTLLAVANRLNDGRPVAWVAIDRDGVVFRAGQPLGVPGCLPRPREVTTALPGLLRAVVDVVDEFFDEIRPLRSSAVD